MRTKFTHFKNSLRSRCCWPGFPHLLFLGALSLAGAPSARAATWNWASVGDSNWTNPASWTEYSTQGLPYDTGSGTADRINVNRTYTMTVDSTVNAGGPEDFIIQTSGTLNITNGGTLTEGYLRQQGTSGQSSTLKLSGGTLNLTSTTGDNTRLGNGTGMTSYLTMQGGTLTVAGRILVSYSCPTYMTQSGGTFNSSTQNLSQNNNAGALFSARISGGTFNAGTWVLSTVSPTNGYTLGLTIDGCSQNAVNLGTLTAQTANIIQLTFKLQDSGWNSKVALGNWNLTNAAAGSFLAVDFGSYVPSPGDVITLATAAAKPLLGTNVALTSLTGGITFTNVSDATGLKIQITGAPNLNMPFTWAAGTGNWDTASYNWTSNGVSATYADGDVVLFDDTATGAGPFTVTVSPSSVSPYSIIVSNNAKAYTLGGNPATTGALTKNGSGNLTLAGTLTSSGGTVINSGSLQIGNATSAGSLGGGAVLDNASLIVNNGSVTASGGITGPGSLEMNGAGTFTLAGTNSYSGGTTVSAGTLQINNGPALGTGAVTDNATLSLNLTSAGSFTNNVSGSGSVANVGSGTVTLTGANSYAGLTTVSAGALLVSSATALGSTAAGTVATNGASVALNSGVTVTGESITLSGIGLNAVGALQGYAGDSVWAGNVHIADGGTRIGVNTGGNSLTVSGVVDSGGILFSNGAALNIRCSSPAQVVILSGANTYLGDTVINAGILRLAGADDRLPTASIVGMGIGSGGGTPGFLDLNGFNQTVGGLKLISTAAGALVSAVTNSSASPSTLTVNSVANTTWQGGLSGNLSLVKTGTAVFDMTGNNTHSGSTIVSGGTLLVDGNNGASPVTVNNGATLGGSGTIGGSVTFNAGGLATNNQGSPLTINGSLTLNNNTLYVSTPAALAVGDYPLMTFNPAGSSGAFNAAPIISGAGLAAGNTGTILTANGSVVLHVASVPATPPGFPANALSLSGGTVSLTATGAIGASFTLWTSTNVSLTPITNTWTKLTNGTIASSPFTILDPGATTNQQRFYLFSTP